ncbi:hypothetical protein HPT25_09415 [Bacillus sp. BRMEA1]|uniref:hypothetical protein n=1 Tax=Neobacillus endophyticus TaxID=2738405 RepID=UPI00156323A5|nr:hypothetical protein [Neobacillus endophyticus]NRD77665.1 hypothetical protein [Neobacillus endophyticus]
MKRIHLLVAALLVTLGLSACSSKSDQTEANAKADSPSSKTAVKSEMVNFYTELGNTINAKDTDLNTYEKDIAKAGAKITPDEKLKASESAASVVAVLKAVQIPAALKDQKGDLESALKDYEASYQMKADELKKANPSLKAANALFAKGEEELGKAHKSLNLLAPSLDKQVN